MPSRPGSATSLPRCARARRSPRREAPGQLLRPGWGPAQLYFLRQRRPTGVEGTHDHEIALDAAAALEELAQSPTPWALYVGPTGPHDPYAPPQCFVDQYQLADVALPASYLDRMEDRPGIYRRLRQQLWDQLGEHEVRDAIRHYWAYCSYEDALLGEVLAALDATGQAANTLVIRTADHGDYVGAHGLFLKGVPAFREAYNVPLIVRWPARSGDAGRSIDDFVTLADLAPTVLEAAEVEPSTRLTGRSLVPLLDGQRPTDWPDAVHAQMNGVELYYTQRAVTTATHKYVYNGFDFDELYDLVADPDETVNLSDDAAYTEVKRGLVERMWRFADDEDDELVFCQYPPVALAPWGPSPRPEAMA